MSEYQDQELQSWLDSNDLISLDAWCELADIQEDDLIKAGFLAYTKKCRYVTRFIYVGFVPEPES
nr:hypothetical protein [uncultured Amphritea sp.]